MINVTTGVVKRGVDLLKASYYFNGGYSFAHANKFYAFGFSTHKDSSNNFSSQLAADQEST